MRKRILETTPSHNLKSLSVLDPALAWDVRCIYLFIYLLKIPVWWRRAVLPSLPWVVCFLSFFLFKIPGWWRRAVLPSIPWVVCFLSFFLSFLGADPVLLPLPHERTHTHCI